MQVAVVPANPAHPGLVYPANAGFRHGDVFVLSNLTPTRAGEQPIYRRVVESLGLRCVTIQARFEGEADLFAAGDVLLFSHGRIRRQRFVPRLGWPPWKRIYGFRSDPRALDEIEAIAELGKQVLRIELIDERYYHGDTCLCSFGAGRAFLLAYTPVLHAASAARLRKLFGDRLIEIDADDAAIYAANSFALEAGGESLLVMPEGVSARLVDAVSARGVRVVKADVSEFHKKGGGSVKCMIGDLGLLALC
jgi:N-dimethylarginine dimethylaminohydrolase